MRKLALVALAAAMALAACSGSSATQKPAGNTSQPGASSTAEGVNAAASCLNWCGIGSASVTLNGVTTKISSGACLDEGNVISAKFGDWWAGAQATGDYLVLPELRKLAGMRMLCFYGKGEEDTIGPEFTPDMGKVVVLEGGHRIGKDFGPVVQEILASAGQ